MPSKLTGVGRKLKWSDFPLLKQPPAGETAEAATTWSITDKGFATNLRKLDTSAGKPVFQWLDDFHVEIQFVPAKSYRVTQVDAKTPAAKGWLLAHEQGHFEVAALLTRDFYYSVLALTRKRYDKESAARSDYIDAANEILERIPFLQDQYDDETGHSLNRAKQWAWLDAIDRARELHRQPLQKAPDGTLLRVTMIDALKQASIVSG